MWLGPEPHGLSLVGVGQPTSFPGRDPTEDAVATTPAAVPEPSIMEGPLPTPQLPELDQEGPFPSGLATEAQDPAFAPLPDSAPDPCPAPTLDPCSAPDVNPVPVPSTSRNIIATTGAVIASLPEDSPQGAASVFPSPDSPGAAIFPPLPPIELGFEGGRVAPAHRVPRQGSAPCLPVLVGHRALSVVPPEESRGLVTPAPHTLREEVQEFLEDVRGSCNKVQLALQRWRDFRQILRAASALMGEGKRTGKQAAVAYQRVRLFCDSLRSDQPSAPPHTFLFKFESRLPVCLVMHALVSAHLSRLSPTWSNAELLDLIGIWGEEAVQLHLGSRHRNYGTYGQISRCTIERGHDQDTLQCRVKVKELWNAYHKAWEANRCSGAVPTYCRFYKELDAILSGNHTSTAKDPVDTLLACVPVESGLSQEEAILDEEGEGDPEAEDDSEARDACSQELFSNLEEPSQSEIGTVQTGEEAPVKWI
ncbi:hypothetical protein UY3_11831 [Chelonia mydas]|uniref:Myb/SANT-like DNA-binding domain-containing protein n=1 Tax=Chelonia mydas TaxID=8469 RepID=M7B1V5_CHEMY|nr:hypothetical protein UY3_11831 [Chelonia mydas]